VDTDLYGHHILWNVIVELCYITGDLLRKVCMSLLGSPTTLNVIYYI